MASNDNSVPPNASSNPQPNNSNTLTQPNFDNEMRIIVEDMDAHPSPNLGEHFGPNFYSVRNATAAVEENVSSLLRRASSELERRGGQSRLWRLNFRYVMQRVRDSSMLTQNPPAQPLNEVRTEPPLLMDEESNVHVDLENEVPPTPSNTTTTGGQNNSQSQPPATPDQPTTNNNNNQPRGPSFTEALADAPVEVRESVCTVLRHLPFALILITRPIYDHFDTLYDMIFMQGLFQLADFLFMKQLGRQTNYQKSFFFFNLLTITSCCVYLIDARYSYLNLLLVNSQMKGPISLGTLLYSTFATDCLLKAITVLCKNIVAVLPTCLMHHRKRGRFYMLIEATSQLYRYLAPVQIWLLFVTESYPVFFQIIGVIFYLVPKLYLMFDHLLLFRKAVIKFPNRVLYGRIPSKKDLETCGDDCSICQDRYNLPVMLDCSHVFCEQCISMWLRRKSTCPMCRTGVVDLPWMFGRTSEYVQLF